jgi:hypothetical protein
VLVLCLVRQVGAWAGAPAPGEAAGGGAKDSGPRIAGTSGAAALGCRVPHALLLWYKCLVLSSVSIPRHHHTCTCSEVRIWAHGNPFPVRPFCFPGTRRTGMSEQQEAEASLESLVAFLWEDWADR